MIPLNDFVGCRRRVSLGETDLHSPLRSEGSCYPTRQLRLDGGWGSMKHLNRPLRLRQKDKRLRSPKDHLPASNRRLNVSSTADVERRRECRSVSPRLTAARSPRGNRRPISFYFTEDYRRLLVRCSIFAGEVYDGSLYDTAQRLRRLSPTSQSRRD